MRYKEVKRNAKKGEFIKIVNPVECSFRQGVTIGEVFMVLGVSGGDIVSTNFYDSTRTAIEFYDYEYVVLEECKDDLSEYTTEQLKAEIEEREKPKYYSGKVVCIYSPISSYFVKGKAYTIQNGIIMGIYDNAFTKMLSLEDLNSRLLSQFIEYVE